jgi:MFS family permease
VLAGFGMLAVTFSAIGWAPVLVLVALFTVCYGLGEGLVIVPLQNYATTLAPTEHRGVLVALWVAAARAGQFTGPVLVGWLGDSVGWRTPFFLGSAVAALVVVVGSALRRRMATPVRSVAPAGS